ncbi:MAG TPA: c-type cytochrome [Bryobacteraceae bacterium]|nr:c-type cytochrome [Bryobacteraceae bacterium]
MRSLIPLLAIPAVLAAQASNAGEKLLNESDCSSCHAADRASVGPSYAAIAKRYAGQANAVAKLTAKIRQGGSGNWGDVAMTPHPDLTDAQIKPMLASILSVKESAPATAKGDARVYTYKLKNGATRQLDFPVYAEGKAPKVTNEIFKGYALYNSYCYRCHGTDATGGELAPDLRTSLNSGMKQQTFMAVAMAGRTAKGMPSWAGFLSQEDMIKVYRYVKARSLDLAPAGRPPSEQD